MEVAFEMLAYLVLGWFAGQWLGQWSAPFIGGCYPIDAMLGALAGFTLSLMSLASRANAKMKSEAAKPHNYSRYNSDADFNDHDETDDDNPSEAARR